MAATASNGTAGAAAAEIGPYMNPLSPPQESSTSVQQWQLVDADRNFAASARPSTVVWSMDSFRETTLSSPRSDDVEPAMVAPPLSWKEERRQTSQATAAGRQSPLLLDDPLPLQDHAAVLHRPQDRRIRNRAQRQAVCSSDAKEDITAAGDGECRSFTRCMAHSEATVEKRLVSAARTPSTAAPQPRLTGEHPQRAPPSQAQQPHPKQSLLPSFCQPAPHRLPPQAAWVSGGGGGGRAALNSGDEPLSTTYTAAATSEANNNTSGIFSASQWIRATLGVTTTRSRPYKETVATSPSPPQPATLASRKSPPAAQVAAQLHERRVAAALQSQKEMREFMAIMRRMEAAGGANAARQRRRRRPCGGAENGAMACWRASRQASTPRSNSTVSHPSEQPSLQGSAGARDGGRASMHGEGTDEDEARSSVTFSEMTELDEDDQIVATPSPYLRTDSAARSVQARRVRGRRRGARGASEVVSPETSAASAEVAAAVTTSRMAVYKLRDRTARGWVALQHRRVARMRAGTPVLQREIQASQQRLLRAYKGNTEGGGSGARAQAVPRKAIVDAANTEDGLMSVAGLPDGTPKLFKIPVAGNLMALTVSWGGIPEDVQPDDGAAGSDGDSVDSDFSSMKHSAANAKRVSQAPEVDGEAEEVSRMKNSGAGSGIGGGKDSDSLWVGGDAPLAPIAAPDQRSTSLARSSSTLSNGTLRTANAQTLTSTSRLLGGDVATLEQAADSTTCLSARASVAAAAPEAAAAAKEEQYLRNELQRRLAQASECTIYGLHNALCGARGGRPSKSVRTAAAATSAGVVVGGAAAAPLSSPMVAARRHHSGQCATSPALRFSAQQTLSRSTSVKMPSIIQTRNAVVTTPASAAAAGALERRADASLSPPDSCGSPNRRNRQSGAQLGSDATNSMSILSSVPAAPLSCVGGGDGTAAAARPRAVAAQTPAGSVAAAAVLPPPSGRPRRKKSVRKRSTLHRRKPLLPVIGVGEHSAVLLQQELLATRRWELEADEARAHDIECTCAMLQRLRPLREQMMVGDTCPGTQRTGAAKRVAEEPADPLLLMRSRTLLSQMETPPDTALATPTPLPPPPGLSNARLRSTAATAAGIAPSPPLQRNEADAAIARSHLPQAALCRQRQLIYDEAVRLDTGNRLEARTAYLDALTQLAHKHVSSVSWPAVLALISELRDRLQREAQLTIGVSSATRDGTASKPTVQAAAISSSSSALALTATKPTAKRRSSSSTMSSLLRTSAALQANPPALPPSAQQYGGLQQLIATHLGVLELTQWPVQEVLQHLAALYSVPLSLLHEWIAEQQRRYSRSYSYEERFLAIDCTIAGRAATTDTVLRLTLHRCRRPPLAPLQNSPRAAGSERMGYASGVQQQQQPSGEEGGLYYIRVRSLVQSVASTAVPLSLTAAAPFSGAAAPLRAFSASPRKVAHSSTVRSLSAMASDASALPPSSCARALNFLGQTLIVNLLSAAATASGRSRDHRRRTVTRRTLVHRSNGSGGADADAETDDSVLAVELMQAGSTTPLACGALNLRKLGFNAHNPNNGGGGGQMRAQNVQIALRRKGYRSAMLSATLEMM
ncbi:conserved hypothetical protein [Leishmania major strain Friedlin]|uniref:Uncharacterized protein n=1 Tax=Leishmania major TaxID=5664 RepID=Q4QIZ7_LEIMA|nr:conserved hypothetical protein [Leishmania major strain Friedlin]CAG9568877.1 hypothetical_protein_-_conserved [Leishmania major strain Friedlin]CAJ02126.1 conserved hypothetical protein [Leishmania major strain Friedlin]|eukprot:XP_001680851.1 conserved hypothetical protein [Leishmania major strain Friedlin]